MPVLWFSAFLAGLMGSGHCLGMCGGIATALGSVAPVTLPRPWWDVLYHVGRILRSPAAGGATMLAFGLGTVPVMAGLGSLTARLPQLARPGARLLGLTLVACGVWTAVLPARALSAAPSHCEHGAPAPGRSP